MTAVMQGRLLFERVTSGGQTGADRAALDFAIEHGIPHGGWCPKGRKAEDGTIAACYQLTETPGGTYVQRNEWNVRDSDATLVLSLAPSLSGGSRKTVLLAARHGKACLHLHARLGVEESARQLRRFITEHSVRALNVAGPRASKEPEVGEFDSRG
jgi:Circularly permutated YpsA SLOG family